MKKNITYVFLVLICQSLFSQGVEELYNEALTFYKHKNYQVAIEKFDSIIYKYPFYFNSYLKKSYALYKLEKYNDAVKTIELGFNFQPFNSKYFFMKAQNYDKMEKYGLALHYINMAIKFNPENLMYYNFRADLYLGLKEYKKAIIDYNFVNSRDPKIYRIYYNRGLAKFNSKQKVGACLDWAYAKEYNRNSEKMLHFYCSDIDLRPYSYESIEPNYIRKPVFVSNEDSSFYNYLRKNIEFDFIPNAIQEGLVVVKFTVKADTSVSDIKILNPVSSYLDSIAVSLIMNSTSYWSQPAIKDNSPIDYSYIVPIRFKILEPEYKTKILSDSIGACKLRADKETELHYLLNYVKLNPFNYEYLERIKYLLSTNIQFEIPDLTFDYTKVEGEFLEEVSGYRSIYKFYFDEYWRLTKKEFSNFYAVGNQYFLKNSYSYYKAYRKDGSLHSESAIHNGIQDGKYSEYDTSGNISLEIFFRDGKPINYLKKHYPNGTIKHNILMAGSGFDFREFNNEFGKSLFEENNIIWEYSNIRFGEKDSLHLVCHINLKQKTAEWKLFKNTTLFAQENYIKGKLKTSVIIENDVKTRQEKSFLHSSLIIPISVFAKNGVSYSTKIDQKYKHKIESLDPEIYLGIKRVKL